MTAGQSVRPGGQPTVRRSELLAAFAYASDLAFGLEMEDCLRSCLISVRIAEEMGLSEEQRTAAYYTALVKDAGCTCWTSVMAQMLRTDEIAARREMLIFGTGQTLKKKLVWASRNIASGLSMTERFNGYFDFATRFAGAVNEGFIAACAVSARLADRLGMPSGVRQAIMHLFEYWDGSGQPYGLRGDTIDPVARVVLAAFLLEPYHRKFGRDDAVGIAGRQRGKAFDPAVVDAFLRLADRPAFWQELEEGPILERVVAMEPGPAKGVGEDQLDDLGLAFADFIDLKSPYASAHSRRVAAIAERTAGLMGLPGGDCRMIRRSGLMHDLGLVAVPSYYIDKPEHQLRESEREALRLHPYHGERVLSRVSVFADIIPGVAAHHERFDGRGYFRGLKGKDIPLPARIIAIADRLDELTHDRPGSPGRPLEQALDALIKDSGTAYDPDIVYNLAGSLGAPVATAEAPAEWPAGLTDREVEVLRLASKGLKRRDIGKRLGISENTVRHHLEHIYSKTGTSTRVAATLFAMENDLLP